MDEKTPKTGLAWMAKLVQPIVEQTAITIIRTFLGKGVTAWALLQVADSPGFDAIKALLSIDPSSKKYTNVMVFSNRIDPVAKKHLNIMVRRTTESGIHQFELDHIYDSFAHGKGFMILMRKSSTKVETPEVDLPVTRLKNTKIFFSVMAAMVLFSIAVLFLERRLEEWKELWTEFKEGLRISLKSIADRFRSKPKKRTMVPMVTTVMAVGRMARITKLGSKVGPLEN